MSMNIITIVGRIGRDLDSKTLESGTTVCNFVVAVDRDYKNGDEKVTDWFNCVAFRGNADYLTKYAGKGRLVCVSGPHESREWTDKEGNKRTSWEIKVNKVYLLDSRKDGTGQSNSSNTQQQFTEEAGDNSDLPF